MSNKLNKILIVVFLTLLIWAWAYMSLEKSDEFIGSLQVSPKTDQSLLVTFSISGSSLQKKIPLTSMILKGPPSKISELQRRSDKELLAFYYDAQEEGATEGTYSLDLLKYLQGHSKTHKLSLTSCAPRQVDVHIERLEEKKLSIQCLDEGGLPVQGAVFNPPLVNIYARKGYNESATVTLTKQQINLARKQPISVHPYVNLGVVGVVRKSEEPVNITIQSESFLKPRSFQTPKKVGIIMSPEFQAQYTVTILNDEEIRKTTSIIATEEAFAEYEKVDYPFLIEIKESDVNLSEIPPKTIIYNFPPEYVRSGQIELDTTKLPRYANIKIELINPALSP